jgi:hypothetical protein
MFVAIEMERSLNASVANWQRRAKGPQAQR